MFALLTSTPCLLRVAQSLIVQNKNKWEDFVICPVKQLIFSALHKFCTGNKYCDLNRLFFGASLLETSKVSRKTAPQQYVFVFVGLEFWRERFAKRCTSCGGQIYNLHFFSSLKMSLKRIGITFPLLPRQVSLSSNQIDDLLMSFYSRFYFFLFF